MQNVCVLHFMLNIDSNGLSTALFVWPCRIKYTEAWSAQFYLFTLAG